VADPDELANRHAFHPPADSVTVDAHERVRALTGALAAEFNQLLPEGREKERALEHIDYAMMNANAAIARHGGPNRGALV
jgi:hypothetical protein